MSEPSPQTSVSVRALSARERAPLWRARLYAREAVARSLVLVPGWDELVDLALTEPRVYGVDSPQVARRLAALLAGLREDTRPQRHEALARHETLLRADLDRLYPEPERRAFAATPDRMGLGGRSG